MNRHRYILSSLTKVAILACISTSAQAKTLATILDYQPSCISERLSPLAIDVIAQDYVDPGTTEESQAFKQALQELQAQASQLGANAIALTSVKNHLMRATKQLTVSYTRSVSKHEKTTTRLTTHLEADLFKLCSHDTSLTSKRTKFNSQGYPIQSFSYAYTMALPIDQSPASLAKSIKVPAAEISLASGAYGITLGMQAEQVSAHLGPPSIEIGLESNKSAWGYGRSHWFIFSDTQLIEINSHASFITAYGRNLIDPRDGFDDVRWKVNGTVAQKTNMDTASKLLPKAKKLTRNNTLKLSNVDSQLQLTFEKFHPNSLEDPISLLTEYRLQTQGNLDKNQHYSAHLPTISELGRLTYLLNIKRENDKPSLNQLQNIYPTMSRLNISGSGVWWLIGNHIQVQFQDDKLTKLRVSPPVFVQEDTLASYLSSIESLGLPTDKKSLLEQYEDASDNFDMVDLYRDDFALMAKYESDEEDAQMYELEIEYF